MTTRAIAAAFTPPQALRHLADVVDGWAANDTDGWTEDAYHAHLRHAAAAIMQAEAALDLIRETVFPGATTTIMEHMGARPHHLTERSGN